MIENDEYVGREAQEERLRTAVEQRVGRAGRRSLTLGEGRLGKQRVSGSVGQQGDVAAACGEAVGHAGGDGEHHVCRGGQRPLPGRRRAVPLPVAVVYQPVELQAVQEMDVLRAGGPQKGAVEAVPGGFVGDEAGELLLAELEQPAEPLVRRDARRREGVGGDIGLHRPSGLPEALVPPARGGGEIEHLGVFQPGDQLLCTSGGGAPGLVGQTDQGFQGGLLRSTLPGGRCPAPAFSRLRRFVQRRRRR